LVTVASRPTLMDTLARAPAGRGGDGAGAVSQMVTEVRMAGDEKRARRVELAALRWWVLHVSADCEAQPSSAAWEALRPAAVEVTGAAVEVTGAAVEVTGAAVEVTGAAVEVTGAAVEVIGAAVEVTGAAVEVTHPAATGMHA
jgi:hypothetical protein